MFLHNTTLVKLSASVIVSLTFFAGTALADTRTTADYIALVVEAEDHSSRDDRWILTEPDTPAQENDPDDNHSDQAVGNAYLELLPDIRVTHDDEFGPPTAMWDQPGAGPKASYPLDFPEAGRYYVHLRGYSTGTEDNGIHVGINDTWPDSGARMQFCTAGQGWSWSGRQRDSGGAGPCGANKTIWVTVEEPGINTFMISAREDGFEVDRIMLIKDLSSNTRICSPSGADDISCQNGSLENTDDVVDLALEMESEATSIEFDESVTVSVIARNLDGYDKANDVVLAMDLDLGTQWEATALDEACEIDGNGISCSLGLVSPSGPEDEKLFEFTLKPLKSGNLLIPVTISTSSVDEDGDNNTAQLSIEVNDEGTLSKLTAGWVGSDASWEVNKQTSLTTNVKSVGVGDAEQAVLSVSIPNGLNVTSLPASCSGVSEIKCSYDSIVVGEVVSLPFGITPAQAGLFSISILATANNLDGEAANSSVIVEAKEAEEDNTTPGAEADTGGTDTGGTDTGGTDTGGTDTGGTDTGGTDTGGTDTGGTDTTAQAMADNSSGSFGVWFTILFLIALFVRLNAFKQCAVKDGEAE